MNDYFKFQASQQGDETKRSGEPNSESGFLETGCHFMDSSTHLRIYT